MQGHANGARCVWSRIWPHPSSAPRNLPLATMATIPCCWNCSNRFSRPKILDCDGGRRLWHPSLPHRDHPDPLEWPTTERGLPRPRLPETNPCAPLGTVAGRSVSTGPDTTRPKLDRGEDAVTQGLWRAYRRKRARSPDCRNPDPHRTDEPLLGPWNGRDCARRLMLTGKGAIMPQA